MLRLRDGGFTLPELLVTVGFFIVATIVVAFLLQPADYAPQDTAANRRTGVASIVQALRKYDAAHGSLPPGIPATETNIGSIKGEYNLCNYLVPAYLSDLPVDGTVGLASSDGKHCNAAGVLYISGYTIFQNQAGQVTVRSTADPSIGLSAF